MKTNNKEAIYLPDIYGSNMVIQRELPVKFWGKSKSREKILLKLDGQLVGETKSNKNGFWKIELEPQLPGGPHCIEFQSKSATKKLDNILFGDVWICSGQSNMEWTMDKIEFAGPDIEASSNPRIRLFNVARIPASKKNSECSGKWMECNPENVRYFSAVGYYFGKEIEKNIDVPIGLINTSWGGTKAEAWTSKEALLAEKSLSYLLNWDAELNKKTTINLNKYLKIADYRVSNLTRNDDGTLPDPGRREFTKNWEMQSYDDSKWIPFRLPSDIEQYGLEIDGAIWFRKRVSLPSNFIGKKLILSLGAIDDFDITFFNGQEVGRTGKETQNWWVHPRKYAIPATLTKEADALIAVRVFDHF
ncbi:MAG TPA: sialate O-acetylesterase, partial [Victivallales bacterium]|nr:sialate O-acetylesterase [Victivallales bacterium]